VTEGIRAEIDADASRVKTDFFVDHSSLADKLERTTKPDVPWTLGSLDEGWEWLAFTFQDQEQLSLSRQEIHMMLAASDDVTRQAYSRMVLKSQSQKWIRHTAVEADFVRTHCQLSTEMQVGDFGCGMGRHAIELAALGCKVTGIDYVKEFVDAAVTTAQERGIANIQFVVGGCRTVDLRREFDVILCLYDVIGSYADEAENQRLLQNIATHVRKGGVLLLSVMNRELTERKAKKWFSLEEEPDALLSLPASRTMEQTGDVFDPDFYMIDRDSKVIYRKEQFMAGTSLPAELLVRDRRFTRDEIEAMCVRVGFKVKWSRFVRAGAWDKPLDPQSDAAKEILLLCEKV
jgi:2-polyprenyl-3-methyl-5-hydroxy-6-metoxy-1,4-benzoquinol methylase